MSFLETGCHSKWHATVVMDFAMLNHCRMDITPWACALMIKFLFQYFTFPANSLLQIRSRRIDLISHNAPAHIPQCTIQERNMHISEQTWAHLCFGWCILGYGTGAFRDLWDGIFCYAFYVYISVSTNIIAFSNIEVILHTHCFCYYFCAA